MKKSKKESQKPSKAKANQNHSKDGASGGAAAAGKKRKREVQVVVCPSAFPDFTQVGGSTSRRREQQRNGGKKVDNNRDRESGKDKALELDVQETIREVHKFGAEGFTGTQKKTHQNAEYERLTGRVAKRQKIPTKILVGMRQKAMKREERQKQELKESGVVSHHTNGSSSQGSSKKKKKRDKKPSEDERAGGVVRGAFGSNKARNTGDRRKMSSRSFGPAPDVGFMKKGMLRVKQPR